MRRLLIWGFIGAVLGGAWAIVWAQPTVYSLDREVGILASRLDNLERLIYGVLVVVVANLVVSGLSLKGRVRGEE